MRETELGQCGLRLLRAWLLPAACLSTCDLALGRSTGPVGELSACCIGLEAVCLGLGCMLRAGLLSIGYDIYAQ